MEDVTKVEVCAGCGKHWSEHYGPKFVNHIGGYFTAIFGLTADHVPFSREPDPFKSNRDPGDEHDGAS